MQMQDPLMLVCMRRIASCCRAQHARHDKANKGLLMLVLMLCIHRFTSTSHPAVCPLTELSLNSANNPVSIRVRPKALLLRVLSGIIVRSEVNDVSAFHEIRHLCVPTPVLP